MNKAQLVKEISNQTAPAKKTFRETVDAVASTTGRKEVEFDHPDDSGFSFYPQGTAESGSIYLKEKGRERWRTVTMLCSQLNI